MWWPLPEAAEAVAAGAGVVAAGTGVVACTVIGTFFGLVFVLVAWCVGARLGVAMPAGAAMAEALSARLAFPLVLAIPPMTMISAARLPSTVSTWLRRGHDFGVGRVCWPHCVPSHQRWACSPVGSANQPGGAYSVGGCSLTTPSPRGTDGRALPLQETRERADGARMSST